MRQQKRTRITTANANETEAKKREKGGEESSQNFISNRQEVALVPEPPCRLQTTRPTTPTNTLGRVNTIDSVCDRQQERTKPFSLVEQKGTKIALDPSFSVLQETHVYPAPPYRTRTRTRSLCTLSWHFISAFVMRPSTACKALAPNRST